jgi:hypothetical protein
MELLYLQHCCIYMKTFFRSKSADLLGFWGSITCALHCAALPVLLGFTAFQVLAEPWLEWMLISFALLVAIYALIPAYYQIHRKALPLFLLILGLVILMIGRSVESSIVELLGTVAGACLIASAHFLNWKILKTVPSFNRSAGL